MISLRNWSEISVNLILMIYIHSNTFLSIHDYTYIGIGIFLIIVIAITTIVSYGLPYGGFRLYWDNYWSATPPIKRNKESFDDKLIY